MIDAWQYSEYALDSEYATVLNMLGLHKIMNKVFHHGYLTGFCRKQPVIHVWQVCEYSLSSQYARAWIYKGREYLQGYTCFCVKCIFKILSVLNVLSSEFAKVLKVSFIILHCIYLTGFWIYHCFKRCQGSEYARFH